MNVHDQNTFSMSYNMHVVLWITEEGLVFIIYNTLTTFSAKCCQDWEWWKNGVEPKSLPLKGSNPNMHAKKLAPASVYSNNEKEKEKKRERFGWTQFKWLHGCIFRWQISELTHFCFSSVMSPDPEDSGLFFSKYTELAVDAWSNPRCTSRSTLALAFLWFTTFFKTFLVFDLWSVF